MGCMVFLSTMKNELENVTIERERAATVIPLPFSLLEKNMLSAYPAQNELIAKLLRDAPLSKLYCENRSQASNGNCEISSS